MVGLASAFVPDRSGHWKLPAPPPGTRFEILRGVRESGWYAFLVWTKSADSLPGAIDTIERQLGVGREDAKLPALEWAFFDSILRSDGVQQAGFSNLVVREIARTELSGFLAALDVQMGRVAALPGCQGIFLGRQVDQPERLLGITRWSGLSPFEAYSQWSGAAAWKHVVDPVTRDVPLRLLAQPIVWGD